MRRLTLTGFVLLIPQQHTLLRLVLAINISIGHHTLTLVARPYKSASTAFFATVTNVLLLCTLIVALLIKMYDQLPVSMTLAFFGFESIMPLVAAIVAFSFAVLAIAFVLVMGQLKNELDRQAGRRLRFVADGSEVCVPRLRPGEMYHLFLSHAWGTGTKHLQRLLASPWPLQLVSRILACPSLPPTRCV